VSRPPVGPGLVPAQEVGFSKNLRAIQLLARDLLTRVPGERIPTAIQYQQMTGAGSGTVQKALALASVGAPTAVLPLPTSPELMGLATALREEFKRELLDHDSLASLQAKVVAQEVLPFY
jgi:hypothetical protein